MSRSAVASRGAGRASARWSARGSASDARLARSVAGEDGGAAFAQLYERYHQPLYRYCRSILRDEHDAQDALQNAMAAAFKALSRGQPDIAVRPWLFRIAHNEAISLLRRRRPEDEPADERTLAAAASVAEPAAIFERRERLATLLRDLRDLTERQRSVLLLRELSGLSTQEIATALSSTVGAVKQTLFEARAALREQEEGRSMDCERVREILLRDDARMLRGRRVRSHIRGCAGCHELAEQISARTADLRALAPPLAVPAAVALLSGVLDAGARGAAATVSATGAGASGAGASAGGAASSGAAGGAATGGTASAVAAHAGGAIAVKALVTAAVVIAGATAAGVSLSGSTGGHRTAHGAASSSRTAVSHGGARARLAPANGASRGGKLPAARSVVSRSRRTRVRDGLSAAHGGSAAASGPPSAASGVSSTGTPEASAVGGAATGAATPVPGAGGQHASGGSHAVGKRRTGSEHGAGSGRSQPGAPTRAKGSHGSGRGRAGEHRSGSSSTSHRHPAAPVTTGQSESNGATGSGGSSQDGKSSGGRSRQAPEPSATSESGASERRSAPAASAPEASAPAASAPAASAPDSSTKSEHGGGAGAPVEPGEDEANRSVSEPQGKS